MKSNIPAAPEVVLSKGNRSEGGLRRLGQAATALIGVGLLALLTSCDITAETPTHSTTAATAVGEAGTAPVAAPVNSAEVFTLQEGDVLKISFPSTPNLDTTQSVRRDGKISLAMVGEVTATGLTPTELEAQLRKLYEKQLVSNEVSVVVVSSSYAVFVSGAVLRPGKILSDRHLSALEAIMEAGGFDSAKADMTAVKVIRQEGGVSKNYTLNLKLILDGKASEPFYLMKSDIVYVPEKMTWF